MLVTALPEKILRELCMFYSPLFILIYFAYLGILMQNLKIKTKEQTKLYRLARRYQRHGGYL